MNKKHLIKFMKQQIYTVLVKITSSFFNSINFLCVIVANSRCKIIIKIFL